MFLIAREWATTAEDLRTLVLVALVTTNVELTFGHRSFGESTLDAFARPSQRLWIGIAGIVAILGVVFLWPLARDAFRLAPLHGDEVVLSLLASVAFLAAAAGLRRLRPTG